ncbi:hypothetical protein Vretimale_10874 [Volvox reticuliferus]|uniref:Uncharacterized protein n=1 Tax=Volvox reticuliferus TaxID=1737510 RepID=A0A8J4LQZ1_9CHLO|nr:hypothetical protein Vretifemale_12583 [Volvox reticuliferus]GIM06594.1 hypothetical protein Vretimale_10874 [Volvox reticuliferus]
MASFRGVGAVISDLESEYVRSRKFLADLCRSLEKRGILKPTDRFEDSSVSTKQDDIPAASIQSKDTINPFANFDLGKESSETSVCSECSTSSPQLAGDLHPEPHCNNNSSQSSVFGINIPIGNHADAPLAAATSSPTRNRHTSGRIYKKPSVAFPSCPTTEQLSQDYTPDRFTAPYSCNLDHGSGLQHRHSIMGAGTSIFAAPEGPPSLAHVLVPPPLAPRSGARHRRSSLDFVPAPPAHLRKWLDAATSPCQQQATTPQSTSLSLATVASLSPPSPPIGNATQERPYGLRRRSSLEVMGCSAATSPALAGTLTSTGAATSGAITFSGNSAANLPGSPSAGCGSGCGGGVSILSRPCLAMTTMKRSSLSVCGNHPPASQQQTGLQQKQQQHQCEYSPPHQKQQPQQQSLVPEPQPGVTATAAAAAAPPASSSSPQVPAPLRMCIERSASAGGGQAGFGLGSPAGSGSNHLPPLPAAISATLPMALTSPGVKGSAAELGSPEIGIGIGIGGSGPIPVVAAGVMRRSSFSGRPASGCISAAAATGVRNPHTVPEFSYGGPCCPSDTRARSGRFSRCSLSSIASAAAGSDTTGTSANASAVATALLNHGHVVRDRDRRSISSGEVSERVSLMFTGSNLVGSGGGSGGGGGGRVSDGGGDGGSPLSARYSRRDSGLSCVNGDIEAHAAACNGASGSGAITTGGASFTAAITAAAAAACTRMQHIAPVLVSPRRSEATRTRPGPPGQQR